MDTTKDSELESVSGGSGSSFKYVKIVNCRGTVNVMSSAEFNAVPIGVARLGEHFRYKGIDRNWVKIQYGSAIGYVFRDYVLPVAE